MAFKTSGFFFDHVTSRGAEVGDIVLVDGLRRGWVSAIGRKYVTVKVYGAKPVKIDPLSQMHIWTGEQHQ